MTDTVELVQVYPVSQSVVEELLLSLGRASRILVAINRLDDSLVYNQVVLEPGESNLGLLSDHQKNTYWLLTSS